MPSKIDSYLNRASQASQIVLVVFAIFGYFYTVRPIYQKEILSEDIAKKEVEYKQLQKKERDLYIHLKKEYIKKFFTGMMFECSPSSDIISSFKKIDSLDDFNSRNDISLYIKTLDDDIPKCLTNLFNNNYYIRELNKADQLELLDKMRGLFPEIYKIRDRYKRDLNDEDKIMLLGKKNAIFTSSYNKEMAEDLSKSGLDKGYVEKIIKENNKNSEEVYKNIGIKSLVGEYSDEINDVFKKICNVE